MKFSLLVSALCTGLCKSANIKVPDGLVEFSPKSCEADRPICEVRLNDPGQCKGCPLVLFLQGLGGEAYPFALVNAAISQGIIGVYIENKGGWNTGVTDNEEVVLQLDDVRYIGNVIQEIRDKFELNDNNLFAIGSGTGAQMAYMLAANAGPDLPIKGIVAKAMSLLSHPTQHGSGSMPNTNPTATSSRVSVLQIMGTDDDLVPLEGGETEAYQMNGYRLMSATDSIETWADHNQCDPIAIHATAVDNHGILRANIISYDCPTENVSLVKIIGAQHHNIGSARLMDRRVDYDIIYHFIRDVNDFELV